MAVYMVAEVSRVTDPERLARYREQVGPTLVKYGGRPLFAGGRVDTLEGAWEPAAIVVWEFDSPEQVRRWYESPEYTDVRTLRHGAADVKIVTVQT